MLNGATKQEIQKFFETSHAPDLGPGPRPGIKTEAELNKHLEKALGDSDIKSEQRKLIKALVLLWHDHLDAAHEIAQDIANPTGSFIHGIMHRREPDYGNAAYWFRRVGKHPAFEGIANRAGKVFDAKDGVLVKKVIPGGDWDPFAFINACELAERSNDAGQRETLKELQAIETFALFDWLCSAHD